MSLTWASRHCFGHGIAMFAIRPNAPWTCARRNFTTRSLCSEWIRTATTGLAMVTDIVPELVMQALLSSVSVGVRETNVNNARDHDHVIPQCCATLPCNQTRADCRHARYASASACVLHDASAHDSHTQCHPIPHTNTRATGSQPCVNNTAEFDRQLLKETSTVMKLHQTKLLYLWFDVALSLDVEPKGLLSMHLINRKRGRDEQQICLQQLFLIGGRECKLLCQHAKAPQFCKRRNL